jgi:hypothetical protein
MGNKRVANRFQPRYKAFRAPRGADRWAVARAHLDWLLANMDWHALRGRGTVNTQSASLYRSLELLAAAPEAPPEPAPETAAAEGPEYAELAAKHALVMERQYAQVKELSMLNMRFGQLCVALGDERFSRPEVADALRELQEQMKRVRATLTFT